MTLGPRAGFRDDEGIVLSDLLSDKGFDRIFPRARVECEILFEDGEHTDTGMAPGSVSVTHNPHHQCGSMECMIDLSALTFGHRTINGIFITAFMGVVDKMTDSIKGDDATNLQFCGYVDEMDDSRSKDGPKITLKARDLSSVLRDARPIFIKEIDGKKLDPTPKYTDTVIEAIQRVIDWTQIPDGVLQIQDPYDLGSLKLSTFVTKKAQQAWVPIKAKASAWDVIEHICGIAAVLPVVELGNLVLKSPQSLVGEGPGGILTPQKNFVFGFGDANALSVRRNKKFLRNRKGVKVIAYDPVARRSVSAIYPPNDQLTPKKNTLVKHTKHFNSPKKGTIPAPPERDVFTFSLEGIQNEERAMEIAKRIYLERSLQELEGTIETKNWDRSIFDLRNGSRIGLTVSQRFEQELRTYKDHSIMLKILKERLNIDDDETARVLIANLTKEEQETLFYARSITHRWTPKDYSTNVDFINLMVLT